MGRVDSGNKAEMSGGDAHKNQGPQQDKRIVVKKKRCRKDRLALERKVPHTEESTKVMELTGRKEENAGQDGGELNYRKDSRPDLV